MLATPSSRYAFGSIPWYSVLIVLGICLAIWLALRQEKQLSLPQDTVIDLALWTIPFGVVGARLYYVLFAWPTFSDDPISVLYIWQGGLAIYGAVLGGLLAVYLFSLRRKLPLGLLTDMIVPGLALAQAIGRWGNYFNMEAYGLPVTDPSLQFFPFAVFIPGSGQWHMATFFYESVWDLYVFTALILIRRRQRSAGTLTLWYVLLYGAGRLMIEGLRTDSLMAGSGSVRISQLLSLAMCFVVLVLWAVPLLRGRTSPRLLLAGCASLLVFAALMLFPCPHTVFPGYRLLSTAQYAFLIGCMITLPAGWKSLSVIAACCCSAGLGIWVGYSGLAVMQGATLILAVHACSSILSGAALRALQKN